MLCFIILCVKVLRKKMKENGQECYKCEQKSTKSSKNKHQLTPCVNLNYFTLTTHDSRLTAHDSRLTIYDFNPILAGNENHILQHSAIR